MDSFAIYGMALVLGRFFDGVCTLSILFLGPPLHPTYASLEYRAMEHTDMQVESKGCRVERITKTIGW